MTPLDLSTLGAGFSDLAHGSQAVFRAGLDAISHPGQPVALRHDAQVPDYGHAAAAALLLALLDSDSRLWLSASLAASTASAWLRFHTGCILVDDPSQAQFAWVAQPSELPPLEVFAQGSDIHPDQSATCVLDIPGVAVQAMAGSDFWTLRGPGILDQVHLRLEGLPQGFATDFAKQWAVNHELFPRGIDMFLATPQQIVGLPRTTRIDLGN